MTRPRVTVQYRFSRYCSLGRSNPFALSDWWMFLNQTEKNSFHELIGGQEERIVRLNNLSAVDGRNLYQFEIPETFAAKIGVSMSTGVLSSWKCDIASVTRWIPKVCAMAPWWSWPIRTPEAKVGWWGIDHLELYSLKFSGAMSVLMSIIWGRSHHIPESHEMLETKQPPHGTSKNLDGPQHVEILERSGICCLHV